MTKASGGTVLIACLWVGHAFASEPLKLSDEFNLCLSGMDGAAVERNTVIDVESATVSIQKMPVVEFAFDTMGVGAYSRLIKEVPVAGAAFFARSGVTIYAQLFEGSNIVFIAKAEKPKPVWIYATIPNGTKLKVGEIMKSLGACMH